MLIGPENQESSSLPADKNHGSAYGSLDTRGIREFMHSLDAAMDQPVQTIVAREHRELSLGNSPFDQVRMPDPNPGEGSSVAVTKTHKKHPLRGRRSVAPPESSDGLHPVHKRGQSSGNEQLIVAAQSPAAPSGLSEGLRERRTNALRKLEADYEVRRSGRGYRGLLPEEMDLFEIMKRRVTDSLRGSMPEAPSSLREANYFRFFEPRVKDDGENSTVFTMAALRNSEGASLVYSNDLQFFGRWMAIGQSVGAVYIELYNTLNRIAPEENDPSESWKTGKFNVSDLWNVSGGGTANLDVQFNYRILYSPEALTHELRLLDDQNSVQKFLTPGIEGSFVFYQLLRAAGSAAGVPVEEVGTAEFGDPVTIKRLTRSGIDPLQGVSYRVTFNDFDASADIRVLLKSGLSAEEQLKKHQGPAASAEYWEARERQGVVHFNLIK